MHNIKVKVKLTLYLITFREVTTESIYGNLRAVQLV